MPGVFSPDTIKENKLLLAHISQYDSVSYLGSYRFANFVPHHRFEALPLLSSRSEARRGFEGPTDAKRPRSIRKLPPPPSNAPPPPPPPPHAPPETGIEEGSPEIGGTEKEEGWWKKGE